MKEGIFTAFVKILRDKIRMTDDFLIEKK